MVTLNNAARYFFLSVLIAGTITSCGKNTHTILPGSYRDKVPLNINYQVSGDSTLVTPTISIVINGVKNECEFDTGFQGLRITKGALQNTGAQTFAGYINYRYGYKPGSYSIRGIAAAANVTTGSLSSPGKLKFMRIDEESFDQNAPYPYHSIGNTVQLTNNHFRHLSGILGAGLRLHGDSHGIATPLAQRPGSGSYIVHFPGFGLNDGFLMLKLYNLIWKK